MIGELVGPHRIVELLGRGGASEVYRAYHQESCRDVALKILLQAPDTRTRARFGREAEALKILDHPNIIRILTVGEYQERPYYTMPFVRVLNLQDLLFQRIQVDRGRFSQDEILRIVLDVARALRYAHGKGIVHRDVKPGNILVDPNFRPVLCDFGLARLADARTVTRQGTMVGTPQYMAPEQLQGKRADHRSDLYSLGLVAYEMGAGALPLAGGEPLAAAVRRLTEPFPPLAEQAPNLAADFAGTIQELLATAPGGRPQTAAELVRVLEVMPGAPPSLATDEPETAVDAPTPAEPPAAASRWRALVGAGLGLGALLAGGLALAAGAPLELEARCRVTPGPHRAVVEIETDRPVQVRIRYGPPGHLDGLKAPPGRPRREHRLLLEPLEADREYAFSLIFDAPGGAFHQEPPQRFRTGKDFAPP